MTDKTKNYTRREFIDHAAKGTAGVVGYSLFNPPLTKSAGASDDKSTVISIKHDAASKIEYKDNKKTFGINQEAVQVMIDTGIRRLTGIDDIGEAWKSLFPNITRSKVISIKVNSIGRYYNPTGLVSHPEVAYSIVNGLTSMNVEGSSLPEENIIIWDRSTVELENADYPINKGNTGVKCYGTSDKILTDEDKDKVGYSTKIKYNVSGIEQYLSEILLGCDYLINLCVLKNLGSGVTLSLKNHVGSCSHPRNLHSVNSGKWSHNLSALNALPPIKDKQVLSICDAIYGVKYGGPTGSPEITPNRLIFSKDPVALDTICYQVLKEYRNLPYPDYLVTAVRAPYNLGNSDLDKIDLITIENPTSGIDETPNE